MTDDTTGFAEFGRSRIPPTAAATAAAAHRRGGFAAAAEELARLTDDIIAALKTVYDPEIPSDIYELGLIYRIDIADDRAVTIDMTLDDAELSVRAGASAQWSRMPLRACRVWARSR